MVNNGCVTGSLTFTDTFSNAYSQQLFVVVGSGGGTQACIYAIAASSSGAGGSDVITTSSCGGAACTINIQDYTSFTGFGASSTFSSISASGSDTRTISNGLGSVIIGVAIVDVSGVTCGTTTLGSGQLTLATFSCQTVSGQGSASGVSTSSTSQGSTPYSDTISWTGGGGFGRFVLELVGTGAGSSVASVTQCYGNCGNPAITLANTNSTHTVNFNQSITIFYQFQSNVNGFLLNVTASMAKSYVTLPNGPAFGIYTIPFCGSGLTPFSPQCPGQLQQQSGAQNFFSPAKGKISFSGLHVPVSNGQWVGIALSAAISGLDVNDTNTNVNLFQTNEGKIPPSIQQPVSLGNSKAGLWAWIIGNVVTGGPTTTPTGQFNCPGFLDCVLPNLVFSFCSAATPSCIAMSGLVWAGILAFISSFFVIKYGSEVAPNVRIPFGEIFLFFALTWIFVMSGLSLIFVWIPLFFFFVVSLLYGKHTGTYL